MGVSKKRCDSCGSDEDFVTGGPIEYVTCRTEECQRIRDNKMRSMRRSKAKADPDLSDDPLFVGSFTGRPFSDPRNGRNPISPVRVGVFDLETSHLTGTFGRVLCGVVQLYSPDELHVFRIDEYEAWKKGRRSDDKAVVTDILACLEKADVVIAHNGVNFDTALLRTRALIHRLPPVHPRKIVDPVLLARKAFRFHSNSLDAIAGAVNTQHQKTQLNPEIWVRATFDGDKECMDYIVEHCVADVMVLEEVARQFMPYVKQIDAIGSWR